MKNKYTIPIITGLLNTSAKQIEDELTKNRDNYTDDELNVLKALYRSTQTSSGLGNTLTDILKQKEKI